MDTHDGSGCLGDVYSRHGRYNEAMEWYSRALTGYEKALGVDDPTTLTMVYYVAVIYKNQGQYDKALEWYQRVGPGRRKHWV